MKKYLFSILPLMVIGMSLNFTSCKKESKDYSSEKSNKTEKSRESDGGSSATNLEDESSMIKGNWRITNSDKAFHLNDENVFSKIRCKSLAHFGNSNFNIDIDFAGTVKGTNITVVMDMKFTGTYYQDSDISLTYDNLEVNIKDIELGYQEEAALKENGMSKSEFVDLMREELEANFSGLQNQLVGSTEVFEIYESSGKILEMVSDKETHFKMQRIN